MLCFLCDVLQTNLLSLSLSLSLSRSDNFFTKMLGKDVDQFQVGQKIDKTKNWSQYAFFVLLLLLLLFAVVEVVVVVVLEWR